MIDRRARYQAPRRWIDDVVEFPDANGPQMTLGAGYGDWNVGWSQWQTGGALRTS